MPAFKMTPELQAAAMQQLEELEKTNPAVGKMVRAQLEKQQQQQPVNQPLPFTAPPTVDNNVTHMLAGRVASAMEEAKASRAETAELRAQVNQLLSVTTQLTNTINQLRADLGDPTDD